MRWIKTHSLVKKIFKNYTWEIPNNENKIYLTFDDGTTPETTNWILSELKKYNAKATFFCIGDNVKKYPAVFEKVIDDGHSIGNHSFNHLNGWKTKTNNYVSNVEACLAEFEKFKNYTNQPKIFRPPYGKITPLQSKYLRRLGYKIILWDIISYDFDKSTSKEKCLQNVIQNSRSGSIIVFHDSQKAFENLKYVLPKVLYFLSQNQFAFEKL